MSVLSFMGIKVAHHSIHYIFLPSDSFSSLPFPTTDIIKWFLSLIPCLTLCIIRSVAGFSKTAFSLFLNLKYGFCWLLKFCRQEEERLNSSQKLETITPQFFFVCKHLSNISYNYNTILDTYMIKHLGISKYKM